MMEVKILVEF